MLVRVIVAVDDPRLRERIVRALPGSEVYVLSTGTCNESVGELRRSNYDVAFFGVDTPDALPATVVAAAGLPDKPDVVVVLATDDADFRASLLSDGVTTVDASIDDELLASALCGFVAQRREATIERLAALRSARRVTDLISESPQLREVLATAARVARAESSILILGETGVGKERVAELIHRSSSRSKGPFVTVNCAAIPAELFESELFGHEKGAFSGATRQHRGQFELAHEGTLFLDEIGEVPQHLQVKLLRALQQREIRPVGAERAVEIDVRVVAATNRDPQTEMNAERFRRDLYYRLAVVELTVPALRDRPDDIRALVMAYLEHYRTQLGREVSGVEPAAMDALQRYAWPGNVRELVNVIERAVLLCDAGRIRLGDLPTSLVAVARLERPAIAEPGAAVEPTSTDQLDDVIELPKSWRTETWRVVREGVLLAGERAYLAAVLRLSDGRVGDAARRAGMSPRALFDKMRRHGLRKEDFRAGPDGA